MMVHTQLDIASSVLDVSLSFIVVKPDVSLVSSRLHNRSSDLDAAAAF